MQSRARNAKRTDLHMRTSDLNVSSRPYGVRAWKDTSEKNPFRKDAITASMRTSIHRQQTLATAPIARLRMPEIAASPLATLDPFPATKIQPSAPQFSASAPSL